MEETSSMAHIPEDITSIGIYAYPDVSINMASNRQAG